MLGFYQNVQTFVVNTATEINGRTKKTSYSAYGFSLTSNEIQSPTTDFMNIFVPSINDRVKPDGGTSILEGLDACFKSISAENENRVIVIVTDGKDSGSAVTLLPQIKMQKIAVVTVGIGGGVNETHLQDLATRKDFYVPTDRNNLIKNSKFVANRACEVVTVIASPTPTATPTPTPTPSPSPRPSECQLAYMRCDFMFKDKRLVPTYKVGSPNRVFSETIVSRRAPKVGVLNACSVINSFIEVDGDVRQVVNIGKPRFSASLFRPISRAPQPLLTALAHTGFSGNQKRQVSGRCVRVAFRSFQTVSMDSKPRIVDNMDDGILTKHCVVFKTA